MNENTGLFAKKILATVATVTAIVVAAILFLSRNAYHTASPSLPPGNEEIMARTIFVAVLVVMYGGAFLASLLTPRIQYPSKWPVLETLLLGFGVFSIVISFSVSDLAPYQDFIGAFLLYIALMNAFMLMTKRLLEAFKNKEYRNVCAYTVCTVVLGILVYAASGAILYLE